MPFRFTIVTGVNVSCSIPPSAGMEVLLPADSAVFSLLLPKLDAEEELTVDCGRFSAPGSEAEAEPPSVDCGMLSEELLPESGLVDSDGLEATPG